jgi:hypothetical protein
MENSGFIKNLKMFLSISLIFMGFAMFYIWGIVYGSWNIFAREFIGVYALVVVLVLSGILGLILTVRQPTA